MYTTSFGLLNEDGSLNHIDEQRLAAELRGLYLLEEVLTCAPSWGKHLCTSSGDTQLVTETEGFELRIDVIGTINAYLKDHDPHIQLHLYRGRNRTVGTVEAICILYSNDHPGCAITDAIVSLVLLGEANWPEAATPKTLWEFASVAATERIARRYKLGIIDLTLEDVQEIEDIQQALNLGMAHAAIDMLCCFARRCYTCKGMEVDEVNLHIQPLIDQFERKDIAAYASYPSTPSDLMFLPDFSSEV